MAKRLTTEQFVIKARAVHGLNYEYSSVNYTTSHQKIVICCPVHGQFEQTPNSHLNGAGCPSCYHEHKASQVTTEDFIRRAVEHHGDRYDYSKSVYTRSYNKIEVLCPIHGSFFPQAGQHMIGSPCVKCYHDSMRKTEAQFICEAGLVHGNKYDYSQAQYSGYFDNVVIICNEHGEFVQRADIHLRGSGCSKCVSTMTSSVSRQWLDSLNLPSVVYEYRIPTTRFHADGFCPETNTIYEFYGDFWHGHPTRYDPSAINSIKNCTFGELYAQTKQREEIITALGYNLVTLWESDWNTMKKPIC